MRFDGVRYGNLSPTDFDAVLDIEGRIWVVFEVKFLGQELPMGQRIALERFIKDAKKAGKHGIVIVADHRVQDPMQDIMLKDCMVREVYTTEMLRWYPMRKPFRAEVVAHSYISHYMQGEKQ